LIGKLKNNQFHKIMKERDTPRTDAREALSYGLHDEWCFTFCRKLEREINELRQVIEQARPFVKSWGRINDEEWAPYKSAINAIDKVLTKPDSSSTD